MRPMSTLAPRTASKGKLPIVPARYFGLLGDLLVAQGHNWHDILRAAQIDPQALLQQNVVLSICQIDRLVEVAERVSGRKDLGFELGCAIKLNSHDTLGYAMISSPTCHHMLGMVSRYFRLM